MTQRQQSKEDWELEKLMDARITHALENYDTRLWERIKAYLAENISPKLQQLFFGYGLLKWVAGVVVVLVIGTIYQAIVSVASGGGL